MNRRDFFKSEELAQAAAWLLDVLPTPPDESPDPVLMRFARRAMATTFEIIFPFGGPELAQAAERGLDVIDRVEDQLTVYRASSEVSRLNARAFHEPVPVADNLFELLELAHRLTDESAGAFDIAAGTLIKTWGFYRRQGSVPTPAERENALSCAGMRHVILDTTARTVRFARPGVEINLGSIGKGYAVDKVAQHLWKDWGIRAGLVHGGHSSVFAMGSEPGADAGWSIGVIDPRGEGERLGRLHLKNRGLGTSSASQQHFLHEGKKLGHILDPRRGWPAEGVLSTTVTAPTATRADALATAFFIQGAEWARGFCEQHHDIGAVLLTETGSLHVLGRAKVEFTSPVTR